MSPVELKKLLPEFSAKFGKAFIPSEGPMKLRLFRNDLKQIVTLNQERDWVSGINRLKAMTAAEKQQHLRQNISQAAPSDETPLFYSVPTASSLVWRKQGNVTGVNVH